MPFFYLATEKSHLFIYFVLLKAPLYSRLEIKCVTPFYTWIPISDGFTVELVVCLLFLFFAWKGKKKEGVSSSLFDDPLMPYSMAATQSFVLRRASQCSTSVANCYGRPAP